MAKFTYNNAPNTSTSYISFALNCPYYLKVFVKDKINLYSKSYFANRLADKLKKLVEIYY